MADLEVWLLRASTPKDVRDRVWQYIGEHARDEGGDWHLLALALAYPGLRKRSVRLTLDASYRQKTAVDFTLAAEFLFALHRLNLDTPNVISRLLGAAYDHASARKRTRAPLMVDIDTLTNLPPHIDPHDQDGVSQGQDSDEAVRVLLAALVERSRTGRDGWRLTERHVALITRTYLDGEKLYTVAAELGLSSVNASKQRTRAEMIITHLLKRPDLLPTHAAITPRRRIGSRAAETTERR